MMARNLFSSAPLDCHENRPTEHRLSSSREESPLVEHVALIPLAYHRLPQADMPMLDYPKMTRCFVILCIRWEWLYERCFVAIQP